MAREVSLAEVKDQLRLIHKNNKMHNYMLNSYAFASYMGVAQRTVRRALSELRGELIVFIPIKGKGLGVYLLYSELEPKHQEYLEEYLRSVTKSIKTQYFNDVVKLKKIVRDAQLIRDIGQMEMALSREEDLWNK